MRSIKPRDDRLCARLRQAIKETSPADDELYDVSEPARACLTFVNPTFKVSTPIIIIIITPSGEARNVNWWASPPFFNGGPGV